MQALLVICPVCSGGCLQIFLCDCPSSHLVIFEEFGNTKLWSQIDRLAKGPLVKGPSMFIHFYCRNYYIELWVMTYPQILRQCYISEYWVNHGVISAHWATTVSWSWVNLVHLTIFTCNVEHILLAWWPYVDTIVAKLCTKYLLIGFTLFVQNI